MSENAETAILAGGCCWITQELMRHCEGVISIRAGWTGGESDNPTEDEPGGTPRRSSSSSTPTGFPTATSSSCSSRSTGPTLVNTSWAPCIARRSSTRPRAAPGRRGHDRRRRSLRLLAQGRDGDQRGRALRGGRGRRSGLLPALSGQLPVPEVRAGSCQSRDPGLAVAEARKRGDMLKMCRALVAVMAVVGVGALASPASADPPSFTPVSNYGGCVPPEWSIRLRRRSARRTRKALLRAMAAGAPYWCLSDAATGKVDFRCLVTACTDEPPHARVGRWLRTTAASPTRRWGPPRGALGYRFREKARARL